jgi:hypothetical protein
MIVHRIGLQFMLIPFHPRSTKRGVVIAFIYRSYCRLSNKTKTVATNAFILYYFKTFYLVRCVVVRY